MLSEYALDMIVALAVRICFVVYGEWQDGSGMHVKYTDVDYQVFTDAARYVANGDSPYLRTTYRYTPLLAWLLVANVLVHPLCGKILFVMGDFLSACLIHRIASRHTLSSQKQRIARWTWLFNPFTVTISTRGSAESIVSVLVLGTIYLLETKCILASGIVYGLAIHFKIYPIIYCLLFYFVLSEDHQTDGSLKQLLTPTYKKVKFTLATVLSLLTTTALCYWLYGNPFLRETYLYHVTRKDTRHNFSVYFYHLYLSRNRSSSFVELLAFLPQVALLAAISFKFHSKRNLHVGLFLQTLVFVMLNKICTSQYFVWYLTLLPLVTLRIKAFTSEHLLLVFLWLASQGLWLLPAYLLEFQNLNTFVYIWLASLVFFSCNVYIVVKIIKQIC